MACVGARLWRPSSQMTVSWFEKNSSENEYISYSSVAMVTNIMTKTIKEERVCWNYSFRLGSTGRDSIAADIVAEAGS